MKDKKPEPNRAKQAAQTEAEVAENTKAELKESDLAKVTGGAAKKLVEKPIRRKL